VLAAGRDLSAIALRFHDIGTQSPFEVWLAIGEKDRRPVSDNPRLRIVRFSKQSLDFGQTTQDVEGVPLRAESSGNRHCI
jgi:hypothetical protein